MDFDKSGWQDAVSAIRAVAKSRGLQASIERSRSGNGGHIWFFFDRPISAKLARDFGSALITEAMRRTKTVKFDAYDRMFPAQTTIPEGGFGNLISLPFQGKAQREGNSVFVDEQFHPYSDQWLSCLTSRRSTSKQRRTPLTLWRQTPSETLQSSTPSHGGTSYANRFREVTSRSLSTSSNQT